MSKPSRTRRARVVGRVESLETRALLTVAVTAPLPDVAAAVGAAPTTVDLGAHFNDPAGKADFALFNTTLGTIPVLLTPATTPKTVANFIGYVNNGGYNDSIVHRSVPGFIWQAGGYQLNGGGGLTQTPTNAPVPNEFGASNVRGTIAMAKLGGDPDSATSQFFFNESDSNAANLDNQNGGFTVFGKVVGQSGLAVMDAVAAAPVPSPGPMASPLDSAPLLNYARGTQVQPSNLVLINNVTIADEGFSAVSDAPGVAAATLQGNQLVVTPVSTGTAKITVVGYGADGGSATQTFVVNVGAGATTTTPTTPGATTTPGSDVTPISAVDPIAAVGSAPSASRPSVLTPTPGRGLLPATVVAGRRARIQQGVALTASAPVVERAKVDLVLSSTTGATGDVTIATATPNIRLRPGRPARVNLVSRGIPSGAAAGTYRVLVSVTDPNGARTTIDTGRTMDVRAS